MLNKLKDVKERFIKIESDLSNPDIVSNNEVYKQLMIDFKNLSPIVEKYNEYLDICNQIEDAKFLMDNEEDQELKNLASEEFYLLKDQKAECEEQLKILLLPKDPDDDKNVVVEIRAGAGGEEAALFAGVLYRMYSMYAEANRFKIELMSSNETQLGGYKEITFLVSGESAYARLKYESGVHRVQRVPETESQGRIQTSTATVAVLPEVEDVKIDINPADLIIESCKSSGAGGQHINKTESAVRITHKPSGIVVECQEERSQFKNKDKALKLLKTKLYDIKQREQTDKIASERKIQVGTGDRSERIRTYNFPQGRITDHRIGLTVYNFEDFINGNINEMIDALATADVAEKLKGNSD